MDCKALSSSRSASDRSAPISSSGTGTKAFLVVFGAFGPSTSRKISCAAETADEIRSGMVLYVPSPAILKAGAYNLFAEKFSLTKLDVSTHLYLGRSDENGAVSGKAYGIIDVFSFDKKGIAEVSGKIKGRADVTAKNIPLSSEELARRLKIKSGGGLHVWGCRAAGKNILLLTEKNF